MQFLGAIKKVASLGPWRQNEKWRKTSSESTVTGLKYVWIQIFLDIPIVHEQGQICIRGFMDKISSGEKFLRFQNPAMESQKQENNEKTCFRVPMLFRSNRFTFEKIHFRLHCYTLMYTEQDGYGGVPGWCTFGCFSLVWLCFSLLWSLSVSASYFNVSRGFFPFFLYFTGLSGWRTPD